MLQVILQKLTTGLFLVVGFASTSAAWAYDPQASQARVQSLQRAATLIEHHELVSAEAELQRLLKQSPEDAVALNLLGVVRIQQENTDAAERLFRQAISTGRAIAGPHINLALLYSAKRPLDALTELSEALKLSPEDQHAQSLVRSITQTAALKAIHEGDKAKALAIAVKACAVLSNDPELLYDLGFVALESGLYRDAQDALARTLQIRPGYNDAIYALARVYLEENMAPQAEEQMRKYLAAKPDDATAQYGLGYILVAEARLDEAKSAFERSLALQPAQSESMFQLGELALQQGQDGVAHEDFAKVLSRDPRHGGALTDLGVLAFRSSKYDEAKSELEQAIAAAPSYQKAHYYYALTLSKLGNKVEAGREFEISKQLQKKHAANSRLSMDP